MSWLTEMAGKAESFLNQIDQNAALALSQANGSVNGSAKSSRQSVLANRVKEQTMTYDDEDALHQGSNVYETDDSTGARNGSGFPRSTDSYVKPSTRDMSAESQSFGSKDPSASSSFSSTSTPLKTKNKPKSKKQLQANRAEKSSPTTELFHGKCSVGNSNTKVSTNEEEELIAFLNDPNQKDLDENSVLKTEVANQSREIERLLKNFKKLQAENEGLNKRVEELNTVLKNNSTSAIENELSICSAENQNLNALVENKNLEIERLKRSLDQTLGKLQQVEQLHEIQNQYEILHMERNKLAQSNEELNNQVASLVMQVNAGNSNVSAIKNSLLTVENEYTVYKEKAKSILKQKDDLISSLQYPNSSDANSIGSAEQPFLPELDALKSQRDLLNAEISQNRATIDSLREDNHRVEKELTSTRETVFTLQRQIVNEKNISGSFQEENLHHRQQLSTLQFELEKEKSEVRKAKELKQKSGSEINSSSTSSRASPVIDQRSSNAYGETDDNLRTRITALSQSLLDKQSLINNISADKQMLQINVERLQDEIRTFRKDSTSCNQSGFSQTVISSQPLYLSESPWDSGISMRIKRAYSSVDALCCQAGVVLRRRPNLRLGFCLYILALHFWVFFILYHSFSSIPPPNVLPNGTSSQK